MQQYTIFTNRDDDTDSSPSSPPEKREVIRSVYLNEQFLIRDLMRLHNDGKPFQIDPTYSTGRFWKGLPQPRYKFDLFPQSPTVWPADCRHLPVRDGQIQSIMFDPPFISNTSQHNVGKIGLRFSTFRTMDELFEMYRSSLKEFYRILHPGGVLAFKCQDIVGKDHKQYLSHVFVVNEAEKSGFYVKDLFILVRKAVNLAAHIKEQEHARKVHCYFIVMVKKRVNGRK